MKRSMKPHLHNGRPEAGTRQWYQVRSEAGETAEIMIYDEIGVGWFGGGVSAENFVADVKDMNLGAADTLRLRINSPGGDLFDGNTIYNYLRSQPFAVSVHIDGLAASAASIIAMAGNTVNMPENSFLMIHNPWMMVAGDAKVMRKVADDLDVLREGAVSTYMTRVEDKLSRDEVITMLDEETWLGAADAVSYGFADVVDEPVKAAALRRFDLVDYGMEHLPAGITAAQQRAEREKADRRKNLTLLKNSWN